MCFILQFGGELGAFRRGLSPQKHPVAAELYTVISNNNPLDVPLITEYYSTSKRGGFFLYPLTAMLTFLRHVHELCLNKVLRLCHTLKNCVVRSTVGKFMCSNGCFILSVLSPNTYLN